MLLMTILTRCIDRLTDRPTDTLSNRQTDIATYRADIAAIKKVLQ